MNGLLYIGLALGLSIFAMTIYCMNILLDDMCGCDDE